MRAVVGGLLVVVLLLGGVFVLYPGADRDDLQRVLGLGPDRLTAPPAIREGSGPYAFLQTQRGSDEPVTYNPCRPIRYEVNPQGAPEDHMLLVQGSIARLEAASGFVFEYVGPSASRNFLARALTGQDPVLIGWATPDELPELAGDVAGIGGSTMISLGAARREYVTGMVALDAEAFDRLMGSSAGRGQAAAILDHELGHLVGLDHVEDPGELMYTLTGARGTYGPGDLEGLARLGNVACRP